MADDLQTLFGPLASTGRPSMMIQLTVFVPAVIAIYAATGAWVFSCDPISKTVDIVRGGLLYGWIGVLFMCARVLVFPY
jgi:hypothetical protein